MQEKTGELIKTSLGMKYNAANYETTIMTMIRPRGGDFVYNELEIAIMLEDILLTAQAGSQGVVFGVLTADKKLDKPNLEKLIAAIKRNGNCLPHGL